MTKDQAIGMFMGLFIGDALGAPNEFIREENISTRITRMVGGGVHSCEVGEWTDDGAMAKAIASAYLTKKRFAPDEIAFNFMSWRKTGHFGTRDYVFDIGSTCCEALESMTTEHPYSGSTYLRQSGNGSIMRVAPIVLFNHKNVHAAVAQATAVSLMTHGNDDTVNYIAAFVSELHKGAMIKANDKLRQYDIGQTKGKGSIMHAYTTAWECVNNNTCFRDALEDAVNRGYDADTVGAVTGMLAGRIYGYSDIPKSWLSDLVQCVELKEMAKDLYTLGSKQ
jgi:ADP-ribosyl-[dinitrogen reductase] hydrolase